MVLAVGATGLSATELKQNKAAGVGSDDLYQFKYTPEDSNALGNSLAKQSKASLVGHSVGQTSLQYDHQTDELLELWSVEAVMLQNSKTIALVFVFGI